jgi:hypothetical protein
VSEHGRVHGSGARAADRFDVNTFVFQQAIKNTPRKRAVRTTSL